MVDIASLLIASAHAQETAAMAQEPSPLASLIPFALVIVVFWFFIIRPQSKRYKAHLTMISALKKGDRVVTGGGIIGKVTKVVEGAETVEVEIASGVVVEVSRATITALAPQGEKKAAPAASGKKKKAAGSTDANPSSANDN